MLDDSLTTIKPASEHDLTLEEKLTAITKLYEEYQNTVADLYEEFLLKIADLRKKDDLIKLDKLKKGVAKT